MQVKIPLWNIVKKNKLFNPWAIRAYLFFIFVIGLLISFIYLQKTLWDLEQGSRILSRIYARFCAQGINNKEDAENIIFEEVIQNISFPVIVTDSDGIPIAWRNIKVEGTNFHELDKKQQSYILRYINRLDRIHDPIEIWYGNQYLGSVHYGETAGIRHLRWAPFVQIVVIFIFIMIGIQGFSIIKKGEESYIWTGMAKEIAHQMGTPLSSLMGWVSVLQMKSEKDKEIKEIVDNMEKDIDRLEDILGRFSRIGEKPRKEKFNIGELLVSICEYFSRRIPERLHIECNSQNNICVVGDKSLIEWAIENLVRNAIDASQGEGNIFIRSFVEEGKVIIEVKDEGKGMNKNEVKKIFQPGYSTKRFGWGVGLPLVKRIIEEYHKGKVYVYKTEVGKGTIMRIELKGDSDEKKDSMDR